MVNIHLMSPMIISIVRIVVGSTLIFLLNTDGVSEPLNMTFEEAQKAYSEGKPIE